MQHTFFQQCLDVDLHLMESNHLHALLLPSKLEQTLTRIFSQAGKCMFTMCFFKKVY